MPEQVRTPTLAKSEKFEINSGSTGITEADGSGTLWKDNWDYKVAVNQWIQITPESTFSANLVGDDAAAMPNITRVRIVRRDVANEDHKTILPECLYKQVQEEQDRMLWMTFKNLTANILLGPEEHIVIQCAGADAAGTGDLDASASRFSLKCQRRRKALS